ncbi:MAG: hypothetical protein PHO93_04835, partial [Candidatus Saccharimonadaceae bacterium]|nr:hypothetical protein [Candidatus Saccharimonadaceae bacterium]
MKKRFIILLTVLAFMFSFSLSGCDKPQPKPEPVDFYLNMETCELEVFETVSLEIVDYYYNKLDLAVTWKSSRETVAVVSAGGLVKA